MPRLLAVDDEAEFTALIQNYFGARGYEVLVANNGDAGWEMFKKEKPDVCLIDLKMPGMHGDDLLKEIITLSPKTKCIMITASEGEGKTREKLMALGATACFDKPLSSLKDLENAIKGAAGA